MATQGSLFINELYLELEAEMLDNIGRLLATGQTITEDNVLNWQVQKLAQLGTLQQYQIRAIAKASGKTPEAVKKWVREEVMAGVGLIEDGLVEALPLATAPAVFESNAILAVMVFYEQNALNTLNLVNSNLLAGSNQAYFDIINKTTAKVLAGTMTHDQALRETGKQWAEQGLPALVDKRGRKWTPEAYINLVTRTISSQVTAKVQEARFDDYDIDLVEISSHKGSRPSHFEYQGNIYSRSGKSKLYPSLASTSYNQGYDGLITGANCQHYMSAFVNGVSIRRKNPYKKKESDIIYKQSQQQRLIEREIRKQKQTVRMAEAMKDDVGVMEAKQRVRRQQARMRNFISENNRTRRYNREQIIK